MSDLLSLVPLGPKQIDQAYPIVQSIVPDLDVNVWRTFAEQIAARPEDQAGIITVQNQGYIHGLFSYAIEPHLLFGRLLLVDNFFVLDLFNPRAVAEALLVAIDDLAMRQDCGATQTSLPRRPEHALDKEDWLLGRFRAHGHVIEDITLFKQPRQVRWSGGRGRNGESEERDDSRVVTMAGRRERCRSPL